MRVRVVRVVRFGVSDTFNVVIQLGGKSASLKWNRVEVRR